MFKLTAPKGFTKLPNAILFAPNLSPASKTLYLLLINYAGNKSYCWPSQSKLATDLGVSTKSIGRWLDELTSHGLITTRRRGQTKSNVYYLAKSEQTNSPVRTDKSSIQEQTNSPTNKKQGEQDLINKKQDSSVARLISLGVSLKKSKELLNTFGNGAIHRQIQWLPFRSPTRNAPGLLIRALENNFPAPSVIDQPIPRTGSSHPEDLKNIFAQLRDTK